MTTALEEGAMPATRPGSSLHPGKTRYPLYRRLSGPQGLPGQVRKISLPPGFDPRTVQPVASRYTDYATRHTWEQCAGENILTHRGDKYMKSCVYVWSTLWPSSFISGNNPLAHFTDVLLSSRSGVDSCGEEKISGNPAFEARTNIPVASHYTQYDNQTPVVIR